MTMGAEIALALTDRETLEGTYDLRQRPGTGDRYMLTPADADKGEFRVTVGTDPIRGRITLLQGPIEAVVMLGATF
jgi:hypothetical protein